MHAAYKLLDFSVDIDNNQATTCLNILETLFMMQEEIDKRRRTRDLWFPQDASISGYRFMHLLHPAMDLK